MDENKLTWPVGLREIMVEEERFQQMIKSGRLPSSLAIEEDDEMISAKNDLIERIAELKGLSLGEMEFIGLAFPEGLPPNVSGKKLYEEAVKAVVATAEKEFKIDSNVEDSKSGMAGKSIKTKLSQETEKQKKVLNILKEVGALESPSNMDIVRARILVKKLNLPTFDEVVSLKNKTTGIQR